MNHIAGPDSSGKSQVYDAVRADLWDRYVGLGLTRLHPIIPPDAVPALGWLNWQISGKGNPARAMTEDQAIALWFAKTGSGKLPGVWDRDGWSPRNVQNIDRAYGQNKLADYRVDVACHAGGIGVSASELPGLDIDVTDPIACLEVQWILFAYFGLPDACIRRVGRAPKLLIPFRLKPGAAEFGKPSKLTLTDGKGAVEWLARGQQWVLEGVHGGTGKAYEWPRERFWTLPGGVADLPEIDEDAAIGALRYLQKNLDGIAGGKPLRRGMTPEERARLKGSRPDAKDLVCSQAWAQEMIDHIPNEHTTSREEYVSIAHHLMGCSDGAEWGREMFMTWAAKWPHCNPENDAVLWDGLGEVRSGWEALGHVALRHAWSRPRYQQLIWERVFGEYGEPEMGGAQSYGQPAKE